MVQVQKAKPTSKTAEHIAEPPEPVDESKLDESTAAILDEVDEILEEMGEDFVQNFVQRGGQ